MHAAMNGFQIQTMCARQQIETSEDHQPQPRRGRVQREENGDGVRAFKHNLWCTPSVGGVTGVVSCVGDSCELTFTVQLLKCVQVC